MSLIQVKAIFVGTFKKFISADSFGFMSAILFREPVL